MDQAAAMFAPVAEKVAELAALLPRAVPGLPPCGLVTETGHDVLHIAVISLVFTMLWVAVLDFGLIMHIAPKGGRYFMLHSCFNWSIAIVCLQDALSCVLHPLQCFDSPHIEAVVWSTSAIIGFHLHHVWAYYYKLTTEDIIHHVVNCFLNATIGIMCPYGKSVATSNLVMCGVPGALDYTMLALVKFKAIDSMTEKYYNRFLNLLLRMPIQLLTTYIGVINFVAGNLTKGYLALAFMVLGAILHDANSIYYCDKVVGNYHYKSTVAAAAGKKAN